jgi:hypothetical protein
MLQSGNALVVVVISDQGLITSLSATMARRRLWRREINRKILSCCLHTKRKERNRQRWVKKKDKDRKKKESCGDVSLVSTPSDSVDETESELEK